MELSYADYCDDPGGGFRQRDLTVRQVYDRQYLEERYTAIDDRVWMLSTRRLQIIEAFLPGRGRLLDFGCGTGRLVQQAGNHGWDAWGVDIIAGAGRRKTVADAQRERWDVVTFFDSLEHLPDPYATVSSLDTQAVVVSIPECHHPKNREWFMRWRHRRPGEHLWAWNRLTLDRFFASLGFCPILHSWFEDAHRPNPDQVEPNILTVIYRK